MDEEATADRAAQDGLWLPECRPVRERWLDLAVVIDDSRFAALHRPEAGQFLDLAVSVGAFRTVRVYLLDTDSNGSNALMLRNTTNRTGPRLPANAAAGCGLAGRQLILVLSDGVGDAWHTGAAQQALARWGQSCPVALVQMLPQEQWRRTGVQTRSAELRTPAAAAANRRYHRHFPTLGDQREPVDAGAVPVPVFELDADQLARWARFVVAVRPDWYGAVTSCRAVAGDMEPTAAAEASAHASEDQGGAQQSPDEQGPPLTAADLVRHFRAAASPAAFKLAVHLAAAPLNPPVMRLVQRVMLPDSRPADLSEVVGSGLLRQVGTGTRSIGAEAADRVTYDFAEGVREELLAAGRRSETMRVLLTVADHLGARVSALQDLRAVLLAPQDAAVPSVSEEALLFVQPTLCTMRALTGPYLGPARMLAAEVQRVAAASRGAPDVIGARDAPCGSADRPSRSPAEEPEDVAAQHLFGEKKRHLPEPTIIPGVSVTVRTMPPAQQRNPAEPPPVWGNVPPRNISFTGREQVLADLHERLSKGTTAVLPEALHGMGGVGKSQIAIEYVYRHTSGYDLIWWIHSERPSQIQQALVELASELDLQVGREVNIAVPAVREALRLGRPFRNWLLVFDNAENVDEVRGFFPTNGPGKILVTSRNAAWSNVASSLEVDVFTRQESVALLRLRGPELDETDADRLAEVLGDLPLAIEQAAVWLAETGMPVEEYLRLFQEKATELLRDASPATYEIPVAAAWNVSLDRLRGSDPAALQLLQVCAFFASEPISRRLLSGVRNVEGPPELAEALADPIKLGRAVRAINQYALAKISHRHNTILLHRLVQHVLIGQMGPQEVAGLRHCGHMLLAAADPNDPTSSVQWPQYADLLPHVLASDLVECDDMWARQLVLNLIDFLFRWGDHQRFNDLAQRAVDTWTVSLGEGHDQTLKAELRLGLALIVLGQFAMAYEHHVHARDLLSASLGADDERTLAAEGYVAADLRFLGNFARARELDEQTYEALRRRVGPDDPMTLDQAHFYGIDLRLVGNPQQARDLDRDTYRRKVQVLGEDHLATLGTLAAVAVDEMECGRYLEARELHQQITKRLRAVYGDSHPDTMEGISTLSVMERKAGAHDVALKLSREAVVLFQARYGEDYPSTVAATLNHAVNLRQAGDLSESMAVGADASERCEALYGREHPNTPSARVNFAVALRLLGRAAEARRLDEDALTALSEMLGPDHPRSLICAINLATDLFTLGEFEPARERDTDTLERSRRVLGADHPTTLACALNLTLDLRAAGDGPEAETLFADTLARYRRVLGDMHPATVSAGQSARADCDIFPIPV